MLKAVLGIQEVETGILLANNEGGLNGFCPEMWQIPAVCTNIQGTSRGVNHDDQPIAVWGIDLISQLPKVTVDYFTKWVEAEALTSITPTKIKEFVYKNIVCRYGVPHTIVLDNSKQFHCHEFKELCDNLQIKKHYL